MEKNDKGGLGSLRVMASFYGHLDCPDSHEQWRLALKLPAEYLIEKVEYHEVTNEQGMACDYFDLFVRHPDIPQGSDEACLPDIAPFYTTTYAGEKRAISLDRVEIHVWQDEKYVRVK